VSVAGHRFSAPAHLITCVAALLALAGGVACGKSTKSAPPPEAIETAVSVSRDVSIEAPFSTTPIADPPDANAPIVLRGRVFGTGKTGVILAPMRLADQTAWFEYATALAQDRAYTVLTFDFRGFGMSTGDKEFEHVDTDLIAAYRYMRDSLGIKKIFVIGASTGGTAALVVAARPGIALAGVVSISALSQFEAMDAIAAVPSISAPKLFLASDKDVPAKNSEEALWQAATGPKEQYTFDGDAHGTNIFDSPNAVDLAQRLTRFLKAH
jgi:pimeloyl-ACP methyl ester carboxylesterase